MSDLLPWQPIEPAPKDDNVPFLIHRLDEYRKPMFVQGTRFEGWLYPDWKECIIDWDDRILDATHWAPLPAPPEGQ